MLKYKKILIVLILASLPLVVIVFRSALHTTPPPTPEGTLQQISQVQGWELEHVKVRDRVWKHVESGQKLTDADWESLVVAVDKESTDFMLSVTLVLARYNMDGEKQIKLREWAQKLMAQTNDSSTAVMGYFAYIRAEGDDKTDWRNRLLIRGAGKEKDLNEQEAKAERIRIKLGL